MSPPDDVPVLEEPWRSLFEAARAAWPGVDLAPDAFVSALRARVDRDAPAEEAAARLNATDVYLAAACLGGAVGAVHALEQHCFPAVRAALGRAGAAPPLIDEQLQELRVALTVGHGEGHRPLLADYKGRGDLVRWVKAIAIRAAIKVLKRQRAASALGDDDTARAVATPGADPELALVRAEAREVFEEAFRHALSTLAARDRTLLRQHFVDGLSIDELAPIYGVHRATAARWLAQIRDAIRESTRAAVLQRVGRRGPALESLLRAMESDADVTLRRLLG